MLLWIIFAVLTAFTAIFCVSPLWRSRDPSAATEAQDLAVYKQQLAEIDDEQSRGLLGETEAATARIEVSRRILHAAENQESNPTVRPQSYAPYFVIGILAAMAVGTYLMVGSPNLPDQPLSARAVPQKQPSLESLVAQVEERLQSHPDDGMGWNVIAPIYMRQGRFVEAVEAYKKALQILGETPERLAGLGEALTLANGGTVSDEASAAFAKVQAAKPDDSRSLFWLAVAKEQSGKFSEAVAQYRQLLERDLQANTKAAIRARLAGVEAQLSGKPSQDIEQLAMINKMVSGLADRLKTDGSDLDGWLKLIRAYTVLGRREDALGALRQAKAQFAGDEGAMGQIDQAAKSLGLAS